MSWEQINWDRNTQKKVIHHFVKMHYSFNFHFLQADWSENYKILLNQRNTWRNMHKQVDMHEVYRRRKQQQKRTVAFQKCSTSNEKEKEVNKNSIHKSMLRSHAHFRNCSYLTHFLSLQSSESGNPTNTPSSKYNFKVPHGNNINMTAKISLWA